MTTIHSQEPSPAPARFTSRRRITKLFLLPLIALALIAAFTRPASAQTGLQVTVQDLGGVTVHSLTASEAVFANSTHIIETENSLVLIDTQFLLPNALEMRAYADALDKPIDRVYITHEHPDHFLGSEAFNDVPVFALSSVSALIAETGQAEVDEKQGDFGPAIASTFVVPGVVSPGTVEIDDVTFELEQVRNAEAENQLVIRLPDYGVIAVGDIVYSGVHLVLAGAPDTWTAALLDLEATGDDYPVVLAGHGLSTDPSVYQTNVEWLATAGQLLATVDNGADFKQGLIDAYPSYGVVGAIDLVLPFFFPEPEAGSDTDAEATEADDAAAEAEEAAADRPELAITGVSSTQLLIISFTMIAAGATLLSFRRQHNKSDINI